MKRIDLYIQKVVVLSMLVVIVLTASVDTVFSLAEELGDLDQNYDSIQALIYVLRTLPTAIYEYLPFSALAGALYGLGILASHNELIVIQSAGVRTSRVVWSVMKPTLVVMVIGLLLGEYIAPQMEQQAQSNKAVLQSGGDSIGTNQGTWQKIGNEFIHINAIVPGGESLIGVTRYRLDDRRQLVSNSFAESAHYMDSGDQSYWRLLNITETLIEPTGTSTQNYLQMDWNVNLSPQLLSVLLVEPESQSISGLYRFANYFENEGLSAGNYFLAFWKKMLQPLSTLSLVLLAVSFVFGPLRDATMGFRIFIAISIGLAFTILQRLLEPSSLLYGISPLVAVVIPILLCVVIGGILLKRVR